MKRFHLLSVLLILTSCVNTGKPKQLEKYFHPEGTTLFCKRIKHDNTLCDCKRYKGMFEYEHIDEVINATNIIVREM